MKTILPHFPCVNHQALQVYNHPLSKLSQLTVAVSTYLHRRADQGEYTVLVAVVKTATDADI